MHLKVKPQLHLYSFYNTLPLLAFSLVLLFAGNYGFSDTFKYASLLIISLCMACYFIIICFKYWLLEVEFIDSKVTYVTELGGVAEVDLLDLNFERSVINNDIIHLVDNHDNIAVIYLRLFSKNDEEKMMDYLSRYLTITD
ncbi:hypothetical protein PN836_004065 [Ningiella sp. W23]|uniref:hypothetical protein n=1 Tax=Ningiella sp. W23 TaxID=3023715 RepID=UPI003756A1EC